MKIWVGCALYALCVAAFSADLDEIELRRLFAPTLAELRAEATGRIYIYEGLRDIDIERAMDTEFERVESMMFIREKKTDENGELLRDSETGMVVEEDDGC